MILTVGIKQKIFLDRSPPIFFTVVCRCATKNRHNYPQNSASPNSGALCLCREKRSVFGKPRLQRLPKRSSVPQKTGITILSFVPLQRKTRHNYLKFCAFAKKNAVSLTNQGCKGCQNEALCTVKSSVHRKKALCTGKGSVHRKKLCAQEKGSVHRKRLCAQEKALRTGKRLCAQEKALCTGKSSVHRKKLCARHWKKLCARHRKKLCARHWKKLRARNHSGKRGKDFPKTKKNFKPSHSFRFRAG